MEIVCKRGFRNLKVKKISNTTVSVSDRNFFYHVNPTVVAVLPPVLDLHHEKS